LSVTIKDIAERAGVSFSTVSKALRNSPLVHEKTKAKILAIAKDMGYQPNIAARRLVSKRSGVIGVVWPSVERTTLSSLITLINAELEKSGYATLLSINRADSAIETFRRFQVDAILLFSERAEPQINSAVARGIPVLCYGNAVRSVFPTLDINRKKAVRLGVRHLFELGHRSMAYIGRPNVRDPLQEEKASAFLEELRSLIGEAASEQTVVTTSGMEFHDGYLAAKALLQSPDRPTALFGGSYDLTRGILRAAAELHIRIPEEVSLVAFDHIPQMNNLEVPVTAVGVDISTMAATLARKLLDMIEAGPGGREDDAGSAETVVLEPELVLRASTAPPASGHGS
jgi:LacI family transcriptional regulator